MNARSQHRPGPARRVAAVLFTIALLAPSLASAQAPAAPADTAGGTRGRFFTRGDAALAGLFAVGTVAMFPLDRRIALDMNGSPLRDNSFVKHAADVFRVTAVPGSTLKEWRGPRQRGGASFPYLADEGRAGRERGGGVQ